MQEPRLRQAQELAQSLNAGKWKSQALNPRVPDSGAPVAGHCLFTFPVEKEMTVWAFRRGGVIPSLQ